MAINTFINVMVDAGAPNIKDAASHNHRISRGTANAGDVTVAFDSAKVVSRTVLRGILAQVMRTIEGGSELAV